MLRFLFRKPLNPKLVMSSSWFIVKKMYLFQRLVLRDAKMAVCASHLMSANVHLSTWVNDVSIHYADHRVLMTDTAFDPMCACVLLHGKEIIVKSLSATCLAWMEEGTELWPFAVVLAILMCFYKYSPLFYYASLLSKRPYSNTHTYSLSITAPSQLSRLSSSWLISLLNCSLQKN